MWATSASGSPGCARRCAASRAVAASSAVAVRAESVSSCQGRRGWEGEGAGAYSSTTCAFVPPMPNELTPARRGSLPFSHASALPLT